MNSKNIFIGEIRRCTHHNSEIYKKDAVLVSVGCHRYVELKDFTPFFQISLLMLQVYKRTNSDLVYYPYCKTMSTNPSSNGDLFVNEETLEQYYPGDKNISVQTLRRALGNK